MCYTVLRSTTIRPRPPKRSRPRTGWMRGGSLVYVWAVPFCGVRSSRGASRCRSAPAARRHNQAKSVRLMALVSRLFLVPAHNDFTGRKNWVIFEHNPQFNHLARIYFGPFVYVWLRMVASQAAETGSTPVWAANL